MKAINGTLLLSSLVLLSFPQVGRSAPAGPRIYPLLDTQRMCASGMQMNPVVNDGGQIAYRNWPELKTHGAALRDGLTQDELNLYNRDPVTPNTRCSNLAMSASWISCNLHESENGRFDAKAVEKDPWNTTGMATVRSHLRRSFGDIWDNGSYPPYLTKHTITSEFTPAGMWHLYLANSYSGSTTYQWIPGKSDMDEPTVAPKVAAWVKRTLGVPVHQERSVWYGDASDGYKKHHFAGYGRYPSLSYDGVLLAFEMTTGSQSGIALMKWTGSDFQRFDWKPPCAAARRPVLTGEAGKAVVAYACWNEDRRNWDLHVANPYVSDCAVLVDSLEHAPEEEEAVQYDMSHEDLVYSKQDNRSSMTFGIWHSKSAIATVLTLCK